MGKEQTNRDTDEKLNSKPLSLRQNPRDNTEPTTTNFFRIKFLSKYKEECANSCTALHWTFKHQCYRELAWARSSWSGPVATPTAPSQTVQPAKKVSDHRRDVFLRKSLLSPTSDPNAFPVRADKSGSEWPLPYPPHADTANPIRCYKCHAAAYGTWGGRGRCVSIVTFYCTLLLNTLNRNSQSCCVFSSMLLAPVSVFSLSQTHCRCCSPAANS